MKFQKHPAVRNPRAIVSVSFSKEEFERVSDAADASRMALSKFIRDAALFMARMKAPQTEGVATVGTETCIFRVELTAK